MKAHGMTSHSCYWNGAHTMKNPHNSFTKPLHPQNTEPSQRWFNSEMKFVIVSRTMVSEGFTIPITKQRGEGQPRQVEKAETSPPPQPPPRSSPAGGGSEPLREMVALRCLGGTTVVAFLFLVAASLLAAPTSKEVAAKARSEIFTPTELIIHRATYDAKVTDEEARFLIAID